MVALRQNRYNSHFNKNDTHMNYRISPSILSADFARLGEEVSAVIGRPSSMGVLQGSGWFYVGSRWKHYGARAPQEIDRQVVAISFDNKGMVENVERFGMERGEVVVLSRRVTKSNIKGLGLIRELMGSFGRVSAGKLLKE